MSDHSIPVDLFNPGQVFACLGFLEAADVLLGDAKGRFDWSQPDDTRFCISGPFEANPFQSVLRAIAGGSIREVYPHGWPAEAADPTAHVFPSPLSAHVDEKGIPSTTKLPAELSTGMAIFRLESWTDGSSRPDFKLYSGNRSGCSIASDMMFGKRAKRKKGTANGEVLNRGIKQLVEKSSNALAQDPFNLTIPMAGSFNMDPRGAWNSMDAGYSPNQHGDDVAASPVVEALACLALEHFRPSQSKEGSYHYAAWDVALPPTLARLVLSGITRQFESRRFRFQLALSGKNKIITFAEEMNQIPAT